MTPGAIMSMDLAGTNSEIRTSAGPTDGRIQDATAWYA